MIAFYLVVWFSAPVQIGGPIYVSQTGRFGPMQFTACYQAADRINEMKSDGLRAECKSVRNAGNVQELEYQLVPKID